MQITQISKIASTTGDTWVTILTGPATITSLTMASRAMGGSMVAVQVEKANPVGSAYVVPGDLLDEGASARLRLPSVVLETGDSLKIKSDGLVDWIASAVTMN